MDTDFAEQRRNLEQLSVRQLRQRYLELFAEATRCHHKQSLVRRLLWRLQALAEGDLSQRARQRAAELARDADLRLLPPKTAAPLSPTRPRDRRLPAPGSVLTRNYKGQRVQVTVLERGFEYQGRRYRSLSAVAKAVTGQHWNGHHFFALGRPGEVA